MAAGVPSDPDWPEPFVRHNQADPAWLDGLPALIGRLAARWSLTPTGHSPDLRLNYVAPAVRADGTPCVLKISRHVGETRHEIAALRLWDGHGAARLLDADPDTLGKLMTVVQKVAIAAKSAFGADGIRINQFNEAPAGQSVFHLHVHVIPMRDGHRLGHHGGKQEDGAVLAANAAKLKAALDGI